MIGWVFALLGALAGAAVSGGVTYTAMLAREKIVVQGAVKAERNAGVIACNVRVLEIESAHNKAVTEAVDAAVKAATDIQPTPETPSDLLALCNRSSSCRSRKP